MTAPDVLDQESQVELWDPETFMLALRTVCKASDRTAGWIAASSGLARSTAYRFIDPRNTTLPKYRSQVAAFLQGCRADPVTVDTLLCAWDYLTGNNPQPEGLEAQSALPESPLMRVEYRGSKIREPHELPQPASATERGLGRKPSEKSLAERSSAAGDWKIERAADLAPPDFRSRRRNDDGARTSAVGLWVSTLDGDWVRADQIVGVGCDRNKVVLRLAASSRADGGSEDHRRTVARCRSAAAARKTADEVLFALISHADQSGVLRTGGACPVVFQPVPVRAEFNLRRLSVD